MVDNQESTLKVNKDISKDTDKSVHLSVMREDLIFVIHSDGTRELVCPNPDGDLPAEQIRGMISALQDLMELIKNDLYSDSDEPLSPRKVY